VLNNEKAIPIHLRCAVPGNRSSEYKHLTRACGRWAGRAGCSRREVKEGRPRTSTSTGAAASLLPRLRETTSRAAPTTEGHSSSRRLSLLLKRATMRLGAASARYSSRRSRQVRPKLVSASVVTSPWA
jgi:hypothetical protein